MGYLGYSFRTSPFVTRLSAFEKIQFSMKYLTKYPNASWFSLPEHSLKKMSTSYIIQGRILLFLANSIFTQNPKPQFLQILIQKTS